MSKLELLTLSQICAPFLRGKTFSSASCHGTPSHTRRTISKTETNKDIII